MTVQHGKEMKRNLLKYFYLVLSLVIILCSCTNNNENSEVKTETANDEQMLSEYDKSEIDDKSEEVSDLLEANYESLNTDKISIYEVSTSSISDNMEYNLDLVNEIKEESSIKKLLTLCNKEKWESVPLEKEYSAIPYYYVSFNNGTMISLLSDEAYGYIMNYEYNSETKIFKLKNVQGPYIMPSEIFEIVISYVNNDIK